MSEDEIVQQRERNRSILTRVLQRLGSQDYAGACVLLSEDVVCDWPYPPTPETPTEIRGRGKMESFFAGGMSAFEPYRYEITRIFDLVDPSVLIAEYESNSRYKVSGAPYRNHYLGIFQFEGEFVTHWREYIDPLVVAEVLATAVEERSDSREV